MPIEATTANLIAQRFDREVEDIIKSADLGRYMGTDLLNPIQVEVNNFNMKLEQAVASPSSSTSSLDAEMGIALSKIRNATRMVQADKFGGSNLGSVGRQMSMLDSPAWSSALSDVAVRIEEIGSQYGKLIINQPDKDDIDRMMASSLENIERAFQTNPSPASAQSAKATAMATLAQVEQMLKQRKVNLLQHSLSNLISQKEVELLNTVSVLKMHMSSLNKNEIDVVNMHSTKATEHLAKMKSSSASYDRAILNQQLAVFDSILAPLAQMRESVQYRASLAGGNFSSPRRPANKTHGFGNVPKRRYHEHQSSQPTGRSPFREAPDLSGVRGFGSVVADGVNTQMKKVDPNTDPTIMDGVLVDTLNSNLEIASAQGYITPADEAILREQLTQLNINSFGGDQQLFDASKAAIKNTIEHLAKQYVLKAQSGEIDANVPAQTNVGEGTGMIPVKPFTTRLGNTLLGGGVALTLVTLGLGWAIATRGTVKS